MHRVSIRCRRFAPNSIPSLTLAETNLRQHPTAFRAPRTNFKVIWRTKDKISSQRRSQMRLVTVSFPPRHSGMRSLIAAFGLFATAKIVRIFRLRDLQLRWPRQRSLTQTCHSRYIVLLNTEDARGRARDWPCAEISILWCEYSRVMLRHDNLGNSKE
jgi:hypothetical protein